MPKKETIPIAVALAAFIAVPVLADEPLEYIGVTTAKYSGNTGLLGFHEACDAEFPDSQFCTTEDILRSGTVPPGSTSTRQWVHPTLLFGLGTLAVDISSVTSADPYGVLTCQGWTTNVGSFSGTIINQGGGAITNFPCSASLSVACCIRDNSPGQGQGQ